MSGDNLSRAKDVGWRQALAEVLAEKFGNGNTDGGMWVSWIAEDGYRSSGAASAKDAIDAIAPIITELLEDQGRAAYQRGREDAARERTHENDEAHRAVRHLCARIIANAHLLDVPFTDAPDRSPWTEMKRDMAVLYEAVGIRFATATASTEDQP